MNLSSIPSAAASLTSHAANMGASHCTTLPSFLTGMRANDSASRGAPWQGPTGDWAPTGTLDGIGNGFGRGPSASVALGGANSSHVYCCANITERTASRVVPTAHTSTAVPTQQSALPAGWCQQLTCVLLCQYNRAHCQQEHKRHTRCDRYLSLDRAAAVRRTLLRHGWLQQHKTAASGQTALTGLPHIQLACSTMCKQQTMLTG
jgi:hypothetical protein